MDQHAVEVLGRGGVLGLLRLCWACGGHALRADNVTNATLTGSGVEGAIIGKALYAGRFTLPQALAAVGE